MTIWLLPIEPLEERYSAQWLRWFPAHMPLNTQVVMGVSTTDHIEQGEFLDVIGTNQFKATQLAVFAGALARGVVQDGDWVLVLDGWNPAVLQLAYMRDLGKVKFKIAACWHAGSYDPWDLLGQHPTMKHWAGPAESAMLRAADLVFVATQHHKQMLLSRGASSQVQVTGFPLYSAEWQSWSTDWKTRPRRVVFPHRLAPEKDPVEFDNIRALYKAIYPSDPVEWVKTKESCASKNDYYAELGRSRVAFSSAKQETWGIAMLEAASLGCHPVVPDRLSYTEIFSETYTNRERAVSQIRKGLDSADTYDLNERPWVTAINNMIVAMASA